MIRALLVSLLSLYASAPAQAGTRGRSLPPGVQVPQLGASALPAGVWTLPVAPVGRALSPHKLPVSPAAPAATAAKPDALPDIPTAGIPGGSALAAGQGIQRALDGDPQASDAALGGAFDGATSFRQPPQGPPAPSIEHSADGFLDAQLRGAREALHHGREDIPRALAHLETIAWAPQYLDRAAYDSWIARHKKRLVALDHWLASAIKTSIEGEIAAGDYSDARERLLELRARHRAWADAHAALLTEIESKLPPVDRHSEPKAPAGGPAETAAKAMEALAKGELRRAEYLLSALEKGHPAWSKAAVNAAWLKSARQAVLKGVYDAFERKKIVTSPGDLRRLAEYAQASAEGRNLAYGFEQPQKQDPYTLMCTIMSIYNAIKASIGFGDKDMTIVKFTEFVRRVLGDPTLGAKDGKGLSTHRVRQLMKQLDLEMRVVEMQERLHRPFEESELIKMIKPGQVVIPVFIIAQFYPDEKEQGLQREEHKGFLRDAYYSREEDRWIFLVADPLIGRVSFYDWMELRGLLHKLFVIRTDKPLK